MIPYCTIDDLISQVRKYRPADVLTRVAQWSSRLDDYVRKHGNRPMPVELPRHLSSGGLLQRIVVAHYQLALIAKLSLMEGHALGPGQMTDDTFLRLLRMVAELYDPKSKVDAQTLIFRTIYEQAPYQEQTWQAIPRALLMYIDANEEIAEPEFEIDLEFRSNFGLSIEEFLTLGVAFYSQLNADPVFYPLAGWHTDVQGMREVLTRENVVAFLRLVGADQRRFKEKCSEVPSSGIEQGRYDFNPLFKYPLIDIGSGKYVAPLLYLLTWRLYHGPFHELADIYRGEGRDNPFRRFFGRVFHEYVGLLLRDAMPGCDIAPEAGAPDPGPVDWLVRIGSAALAVECRAADLKLETKSSGDPARVEAELERVAIDTIARLPAKIGFLQEHASAYGLNGVDTWHSLLVVKEPLLPVPLTRALIDSKLEKPFAYHLLSIADFEQLVALHEIVGVENILAEKAHDHGEISKDFRTFLYERQGKYGYRRNPLLDRTFDTYFERFGVLAWKENSLLRPL